MTYERYTDAVLSALKYNPKKEEAIARKQDLLDSVYRTENLEPNSVLFVGFTPAILSCSAKVLAVTEISEGARKYLDSQKIKYNYIKTQDLTKYHKDFQCVVALDEYFTFTDSDSDQQTKIRTICDLATDFVISTVKDYKNQDFKEKDFSTPVMVRNSSCHISFFESHDWDVKDRNRWVTRLYEIADDSSMVNYGIFERRTMFFKQLAKFSMDAGAANFMVHKNLMYKSLIKKNYEHVVSVQFR
jgi:hypothetical protein